MHNSFFCKLRRSLRLQEKNSQKDAINTLGIFVEIPLEVIYRIFYFMPLDNLGSLTLTSKAMRDLVETYVNSNHGLKLSAPACIHTAKASNEKVFEIRRQFQILGILMKRLTCLYPTSVRLRKIDTFVSKLNCSSADCDCLHKCVSLPYYGKFIQTIISGWDESEYTRVYSVLEAKSNINSYLETVFTTPLGSRKHLELIIRLFFRSVFLDESEEVRQRSYWLSKILRSVPEAYQPKLLLILYGPVIDEQIQWNDLTENVPANLEEAKLYFKELACALDLLFNYCTDWDVSNVIKLTLDLTSIPMEWENENISALWFLCGKQIIIVCLNELVKKFNYEEASHLITSLSLTCLKFTGEHNLCLEVVKHVGDLIQLKTAKITYWTSIADAFRYAIMTNYDLAEIGDENSEDSMVKLLDSFLNIFKFSLNFWNFDAEE